MLENLNGFSKNKLTVVPPFPDRVVIELTNNCNLYCKMCPRRLMKSELGDMKKELFFSLIDTISKYEWTSIAPFFRGESLLHPNFLELMKYARKKIKNRIMLFSNGILFDQNISDNVIKIGLDHISFSLDSVDEETYKKIRGKALFDQVVSNIKYLVKKRNIENKMKPEIQVSMVKTKWNENIIKDFIKKWGNKVDRVRVYEEHTVDSNFGKGGNSYIYQFDRKPCLKPFNEIAVYWNGNIALCNHDWERHNILGNANISPLDAIWESNAYRLVRKLHLSGNYKDIETCGDCDQWKAYYNKDGIIGELVTNEGPIDFAYD